MYENNDKISHNKSPSTSRDWEMAKQKTKPLGERFCTLYNNCQIGDEFHYILECNTIQNIR